MVPLPSKLESTTQKFAEMNDLLEHHQFALGGGWEYENGCFDRSLDENRKIWLRIPFQVLSGTIDPEAGGDATIRLGQPYVLKHLYNEGTDPEGSVRLMGALFDQFQSPVDPDADIEPKWIDRAKHVLAQVENVFR